ncbi:ABC transporter ATP-binding protein [Marinomonas mediterranea]|jgi:carbohydrate ABC transporter ATP-binding protein, CUT1 family (TC 3.A.1.1.-)|uniref:Glycerol-3-phosphate-transporting ATPase n=1 Tax=Marinomonas mediterranea (strain ATCC 700492 / JCM 21426 / NBRC 103028 / MMB-1) TaxID=717774 RepID=F2K042_MARM1|nr:ABC transporter ATP-binding protein [Marinomonas mediterranea]ADZ93256.1 Glycerol-3-phosphate-transporting ATPase [Marinomonas mediterranea MMB-1]WCN11144.1 sn-glycerol-3-phosphate ABC transporter ATP-binding protein UgpC [Marinomonas mediterranea]WCN15207.1 sn-glycerol-3-phosphate ABC transporter ATP-binding protein UgpC [Marinomonas mediterranea]WCN19251.1 sn-glycerol-3-phosphate ABC transporter ATP-binding protein UgpC [Marinomonas mediterranea MMB-1]
MANLVIENVKKRYGQNEILKGINISIETGEFLILVGPSGCGKSTLMNSIAGLEEVSDGRIMIDGQDVTFASPKDRDIAMVFQSYALYPNMTVAENISFGLEMRKVPKEEREKEVTRVAEMLQIGHLLKRKPAQLSGGQRQRVAMGRALARRPKMYLFDEPLSNLDAKLRVEMRTEIKKLHQKLGTTIVYVTHDQIEAMTLADRIAVMKDGEVQQLGTPQEIYDDPANLFVAGFMGSPAMNFIPAKVVQQNGTYALSLETKSNVVLPFPKPGALSSHVGNTVLLGLRPEMITEPQPHKEGATFVVKADIEVEVTEPMGADTMIITRIQDAEVNCRSNPAYSAQPGDVISMMFDTSKAVVFDKDTEERLDK